MYKNILKFSAIAKNMSFSRGWKDAHGNVILVAEVGGKKHAFYRGPDSQDWYYFYGVGARKVTPDAPAGRGDFIIEQRVEPEHQAKVTELLNTIPESKFNILSTKSGVSWYPSSEKEKVNLANLVQSFAELNLYLSQNGMIHTGGDIKLYGDDITSDSIMKYKVPVVTPTPKAAPNSSDLDKQNQKRVTPQPQSQQQERNTKNKSSDSGIFGGSSPNWITNDVGNGYEVGPQHHQGRSASRSNRYKADPEKNWYSDNAWDVLNPAGTKIYSLTNGVVKSIKDSSSSAPNIYGTQIIVGGEDGYPDIFYTHTDAVAVSVGDTVKVGDLIAQIGLPKTKEMPHHVHIGLPPGVSISSLMNRDGSFIRGKSSGLVS